MGIYSSKEMVNKAVLENKVNLKLPKDIKTEFLTFGISEIAPGESTTEHSHAIGEEFIFILEGEGLILLDQKRHEIKKDDLIFIKSGQSHQFTNEKSTILRLIFAVSPPVEF